MYDPKDVVNLDTDPLADKANRTAVVIAESEYTDWARNSRYNIVCLTTDFDEYEDNPHTNALDKDDHTANGSLENNSLICPWATLAQPGRALTPITDGPTSHEGIALTDEGHEVVIRTVYSFFSGQNDY